MNNENIKSVKGLSLDVKKELLQKLIKDKVEMSYFFPLSFSQERLWILDRIQPGNSAYKLIRAVRLKGKINITAMEKSINEIIRRHESLRTTFKYFNEQPVQVIKPAYYRKLELVDITDLPVSERFIRTRNIVKMEVHKSFSLETGPLMSMKIVRLDENDHVLIIYMHHIVSDAWSMGIFFHELSILYKAFSLDRESPLKELPIQYKDFATWQQKNFNNGMLNDQLSYWRKQLEGIPILQIPTDQQRPEIQTYNGANQLLKLSPQLSKVLKGISKQEGVTIFMILLVAFKVLLNRYTGQFDISVGTPIANRNKSEIEDLIGFFVNTMVIRTDLSGNPTFLDLLKRIRKTTLDAYTHQDLPFEKLLEALNPERDMSSNPIFSVFFNMLNVQPINMYDLQVELFTYLDRLFANFDITLYIREQEGELEVILNYNKDLFNADRMVEMLEQYKYLLEQIAENQEKNICDYSLLTPTSQKLLPNPTEKLDSMWYGSVQSLFSQQARLFPKKNAIIDKEGAWSYNELDIRSNQLANYLLSCSIQSQEIIAIYGYRNISLVWAVFGILKAGAAFLILDSEYPASFLRDFLMVAKPCGWIHIEEAGKLNETIEEALDKLSLKSNITLSRHTDSNTRKVLSKCSKKNPDVMVSADDVAYIAFTSGSTGKPKGIQGRHGSLSHFLPWQKQEFGLSESDRYSMFSGLSHDPLQRDIFTPLCLGATLCIPDPEYFRTPSWIVDWINNIKISVANLTPAMIQLLAQGISNNHGENRSLRYVFTVGDVLKNTDVIKLKKLAPLVNCVNYYGTTETQRALGYYVVPEESNREIIPLGKGMKDVQLLVLNNLQRLSGIGEIGEIYIRSPHLAKGYLNNIELTQERFIVNPYTKDNDDKLYKTGDLGRYLPSGDVEFIGRADRQIKIRGYRVEPKKIEIVLEQHPAVKECVITLNCDQLENKLFAFIVCEQSVSTLSLRKYLRDKLPEYMIPSNFIQVDKITLTPNGKIDYNTLSLQTNNLLTEKLNYISPRTELEKQIAKVWQDVLHVDKVGLHDNFFDLGGHSLLVIKVISKLEDMFEIEVTFREFTKQTLEQFTNGCARKISEIDQD